MSSYEQFQREDERMRAVYERLVSGVSCQNYARTIESVQDGYGISKSVVSRAMVEATTEQVRILCERDLKAMDLCTLVIDGIRLGDTVVVVALGVETNGTKHIVGFWEGATENSHVCIDLLEDMARRGLSSEHPLLIVLDGSRALRSAVERFFGRQAVVQRCNVHKRRNVLEYLPKQFQAEVSRKLKSAYAMNNYTDAKHALEGVVRHLKGINERAARSLEEGLEETLTVHRLGLPDVLRKSFSSTNLIESTFSQGKAIMCNVKRWRNSSHVQR